MSLTGWLENVGGPVALDLAPRVEDIRGLDILSWNLAVGAARFRELIGLLRDGAFGEIATPTRPLIVLAQEAYRADDTIPERAKAAFHGGAIQPARPDDIVDAATALGLSLRYAPSMRNGAHRSDRGNAILSSVALSHAFDFELPFVRQRRSTVTARVAGLPDLLLASAHLDVSGQPDRRRFGRFGAGRSAQAKALAEKLVEDPADSVLIGADLNTQLGMFDPALRTLVEAGLRPARRVGRWRHTYHKGPVRLLLDHVLYRARPDRKLTARVRRLDEHPGDRGRNVFGSDHHPLLVGVDLDGDANEAR
jgi:hypothetical protein